MTRPAPSRSEDGSTDAAHIHEPLLLMVEATPLGVRAALTEVQDRLRMRLPGPGALGTAETVLAEVLNNIVEHAYGGLAGDAIELRLQEDGAFLFVDVRDCGAPIPGGAPPPGTLPDDAALIEDPPEGGFGWFLIRALTRDIAYARRNGQNHLTFCVPICEGT